LEVVVRFPSSSIPPRAALAALAVSVIALAGCGGGSSSTIPNAGSNAICDSNAAGIQLARPTSGFPQTSANTIEIVANGNADQLAQFTNQFDLNLFDNFGNEIDTGPLTAVPDTGGPHPYNSDFFYAGTLQSSLQFGRTYTVYLNAPNTNCSRGVVGSFST
jgi:hypothetical protein